MFAPDFTLLISLFARAIGFFFLSPLFRWQNFPRMLRLGFAFLMTALLFPLFLQSHTLSPTTPFFFALTLIKELALGYGLGLLFSLLFEGVMLAGEMIGGMMGLSLTEVFDPLQNGPTPILGTLFALLTAALIFALDAHHLFIKSYSTSFSIIPVGAFSFTEMNGATLIRATSELFALALQFALLPFILLLLTTLFIAFASKMFPEIPILWLGLSCQLLIGLLALTLNFGTFPDLIKEALEKLSSYATEWAASR